MFNATWAVCQLISWWEQYTFWWNDVDVCL